MNHTGKKYTEETRLESRHLGHLAGQQHFGLDLRRFHTELTKEPQSSQGKREERKSKILLCAPVSPCLGAKLFSIKAPLGTVPQSFIYQ